MTDKLQVKEHLRNGALYRPVTEPFLGREWKHRLFYQHTLHQQLKTGLQERPRFLKLFVCISVPVVSVSLVFAAYFGLIHPELWFESIMPFVHFDVPPIGIKEICILFAIANGLTLLIRKRDWVL